MRPGFYNPNFKKEERPFLRFNVHIKADLHGRTGGRSSPKAEIPNAAQVSVHFKFNHSEGTFNYYCPFFLKISEKRVKSFKTSLDRENED